MDEKEWLDRQTEYWDSLADTYDETYDSAWSARENALVAGRLASLLPSRETCNVVELGCGTGLGYGLLASSTSSKIEYTGIDVSPRMLATFKRKYPVADIGLVNVSVEEVPEDQFENIDLVMAIFTSASYVRMPLDSLLQRILMWLNPKGGCLYLSFLNRASLRLAPQWGLKPEIQYASRCTRGGVVPAIRYSRSDLVRASYVHGLEARIVSLGPLAGLLEFPFIWPLNSLLADFSAGSHTIEMIAKRGWTVWPPAM
ncbi:class I SAM-dependent methyltransferase [Streptomyces europaeiscabiei]|uniref:methyltransferase domain-containing protein n=1 Tax=Streptomyces europaeiscabiei TaxID=146819 RepID=UPI0030E57528